MVRTHESFHLKGIIDSKDDLFTLRIRRLGFDPSENVPPLFILHTPGCVVRVRSVSGGMARLGWLRACWLLHVCNQL